jgi:hypothetical protein
VFKLTVHVVIMVDSRRGSVGRGGPVRRGRGRPPRRTAATEAGAGIQTPEGDGTQVPIQQTTLGQLDRATLLEMLREVLGESQSAAPEIQIPIEQPTAPEPTPDIPVGVARPEKRIDWVKTMGQCRPPHFSGDAGEDIEMWFRQLDGIFNHIDAPVGERQRLSAGLLRKDAFDRWMVCKKEQTEWSYDDFQSLMLREYSPPGTQTAREIESRI